jgi:hypothetical protein
MTSRSLRIDGNRNDKQRADERKAEHIVQDLTHLKLLLAITNRCVHSSHDLNTVPLKQVYNSTSMFVKTLVDCTSR